MLKPRGPLAWWFLAVALVAGLGFMAVIPPGGGADEPNHFLRVWQLAHGQVTPAVAPDGEVLGSFPACYTSFLARDAGSPRPVSPPKLVGHPDGLCRRGPEAVSMGNTAVNSPATYLASTVADAVAIHVGLSVPGQLLAARLASLAAFLAIVFVALRVAPARWQPLLFIVACLPVSLELASTVSSDGMPIALSLLAVALVLRLRADPDVPRWWTAALGATLVVLAVSKNTYGPLVLLVFLVPAERFGAPGARRWFKRLVAPVIAVLLVGWWASRTDRVRHVTKRARFAHIDLRDQMLWVVHHPLGFLGAVERGTVLLEGPGRHGARRGPPLLQRPPSQLARGDPGADRSGPGGVGVGLGGRVGRRQPRERRAWFRGRRGRVRRQRPGHADPGRNASVASSSRSSAWSWSRRL